MFYYLYEIRNNLNGKIYVGVHKTKDLDDGYMGSGKIICSAIQKHGRENFTKVILETFETSEAMYAREAEIVTEEFLARDDVYNLRRGGHGGFDYINSNGLNDRTGYSFTEEQKLKISKSRSGIPVTEEHRKRISENNGMKLLENKQKIKLALTGRKKTEEHKRRISEAIKRKHAEKNAAII